MHLSVKEVEQPSGLLSTDLDLDIPGSSRLHHHAR